MRQMHSMPVLTLKRHSQIYTTMFLGERSHDASGPYRESFTMYCGELQSALLPLLRKTANHVGNVGLFRARWVLNPAARAERRGAHGVALDWPNSFAAPGSHKS